MKKILAAALVVIGLLALALIIWFVGPLFAFASFHPLEPEWVRLTLIGLIFLAYIGKKLWELFKAKRTNQKLMEGLLQPAPAAAAAAPSASAEEVATLNKRFEEAVSVLRQVRLSAAGRKPGVSDMLSLSGRQYLYQLPWYIFIGAPGSGKTTALINSGLQFPLAEKFGTNSIRGVGGTRNCDWWFTDEAVLLDTAGRYTTQESDRETDKAAWNGFLTLLKKFRPRRPINGIILTVSVPDLLQQSAAERETHAQAVRARIQELHEQFHIRFPIYVLVTKCDLLAGFMEFFGEYGKDERAQVWGMTFPYRGGDDKAPPLAGFGGEYEALEKRVYDRLLERLQQERDPARRALAFGFPQQFGSIRPLLSSFLEQVFATSKFEESPMLRGVYFTSGTQEGSPIDRVMGGLARAFGLERRILPPQAASGRSYFLTNLLKNVVFHESGLAGTNLKWERRRTLLQWGAYAAMAVLAVGLAAAWGVSYSRNKAYVAAVDQKVAAVKGEVEALPAAGTSDVVSLLPVLRSVQALAATSDIAGGEVPAAMGYGLFQGDKLSAASNNAYRRLLQDAFLPRLALRVEEQLRGANTGNLEYAYEALKAYLMLNDAGHFDPVALKAWIGLDWERTLPREVTAEQRQELEAHLAALLEQGAAASPIPPDQTLVQNVRSMLASFPLPQRVYSRLKRQGVGADFPEFTVARAGGPAAPLVFVRVSGAPLTTGVPGLFSYDGYHKAFVAAAEKVTRQLAEEEGWVLGIKDAGLLGRFTDPQAVTRLTEDVRRIYLEDYARVWEAFVADIKLKRSTSLQDSIQIARVLSAVDSPLPALLRAVSRETTLTPQDAQKSVVDKAAEKVMGTREDLIRMLGGGGAAPAGPAGARLESIVDDRFDGIRRLVTPLAPGQPAPIDQATALINEVYTLLNATETAVKGGNAPPQSDVPNRVKAESARMPEPVRSVLQTLSAAGASQTLGATRANLSQSVSSNIGDFCKQAINGRYPFVRSSNRDVTQDDFARLFAPGGLFDDFFQRNLLAYVDTATRPWSFKRVNEQSMGGSASLVQFQRAAAIRDTFFRAGGRSAGLRLDFKPVEMDASITQFILDVDGQLVKYSHGPQVPQSVQWPGTRGSSQVRVQIQPPSPSGTSGMVTEGPWALFRMFDRVQIEQSAQPERFRATFNIEGRKATFEVVASSVQNPFRMRDLDAFQCPSGL